MSQTKADADNLVVRIKLAALVSERDGMIAANMQRAACGNSMAYDDAAFFNNADKIRALLADVKAEP